MDVFVWFFTAWMYNKPIFEVCWKCLLKSFVLRVCEHPPFGSLKANAGSMCPLTNYECMCFYLAVGCRRPPVPTHGSTEGQFHHSGARIKYHCDPGFELQGFRTAICLSDGTWSAPAPECGKMKDDFFPLFLLNHCRVGKSYSTCLFLFVQEMVQVMEKNVLFFPSLQCQWKEFVLCHPNQETVTTF